MRKVFCALSGLLCLLCTAARADLHDPQNSADYLILSTDALIQNSWIDDLVTWRAAQGRTARAIAVEEIYTEFGNGTPSDSTLRDFLFYARANWQPPQLKDVFIVGWHDVVPCHVMPDSESYGWPDSIRWRRTDYLSDLFYADDPATEIPVPVFNIGRLPWSPADTLPLWDYYAKITAYETSSGGDWQTRVQLIADYSDPFPGFNFWQTFAEPMTAEIHGGYAIERDYADPEAPVPYQSSREDILADLNAGSFLCMYFGHGGQGMWSGELLIATPAFDSLANGARLPIVIGMGYDAESQQSGFATGDRMVSLLRNAHGGAIGYFGNTVFTWVVTGQQYRKFLARHATHDSVHTLGDVWQRTTWQYVESTYPSGYDEPESPSRQTAYGTMLLGDPGLVLPVRLDAAPQTQTATPQNARIVDNYPNPFNAQTNIVFELPREADVALRIFDITGREVATLLTGPQAGGVHTVPWDAAAHASGIYFVALQAGGSQHVRKITLLK